MTHKDPFDEMWDEHESTPDTIDSYDVSDYYSSEDKDLFD